MPAGGLLPGRLRDRQAAMADVKIDRGIEIRVGEFLDHIRTHDPDRSRTVRHKGRDIEGADADDLHLAVLTAE